MDEIIEKIKEIINWIRASIYVVAGVIAALPFIEIGNKVYIIVILGLILFIISPREAGSFIAKRTEKILIGYVTWVIIIILITEVLLPSLK
jgi:hypothetical protein